MDALTRKKVKAKYLRGSTLSQISQVFGFSREKVRRILIADGVEMRSRGRIPKIIDIEEAKIIYNMRYEYQDEQVGLRGLSKVYGVSHETIRQRLLNN